MSLDSELLNPLSTFYRLSMCRVLFRRSVSHRSRRFEVLAADLLTNLKTAQRWLNLNSVLNFNSQSRTQAANRRAKRPALLSSRSFTVVFPTIQHARSKRYQVCH
jgi:hypothetical protein